MRLWRATRVLSAVGGSQRVDGLEAPLTGRDAELRTVKDLFHAAAERRVPRLVLVSGPAGVGKSRLGWEFEKYADGLAAQVWWHRGRCLSYGEGVAFWALAEIVRQRLGIAEEDPPEVATDKLAAGLDRFVPDPDERAYAGVRLGRLLGVAAEGDSGGSPVPGISGVRAGAAVAEFVNPVTRSTLKLTVHPWMSQGTALLMSYQLPQTWTHVDNAWEMTCVQDYVSVAPQLRRLAE